jgi:hypothetical protein
MENSFDKYNCPVCKVNTIYDGEGLLLGESLECECCNKRVCHLCLESAKDREEQLEIGYMPKYLISTFIELDMVCSECLNNAEKDYIDEIPYEDLPLHINNLWWDEFKSKEYFIKKLNKG